MNGSHLRRPRGIDKMRFVGKRALGVKRRYAVLVAAVALALALAAPLSARLTAGPRARIAQASVDVKLNKTTVTLPNSFFGVSIEYFELPMYETQLADFERVLTMLRVPGDGPMTLRIGGDSADQTYWKPPPGPLPPGSYVLTPAWFAQTAKLVHDLGLRVILDFNLKAHSPKMAASMAHEALSTLPKGSIAGFEVGNEPDRFGHGYSVANYVRDFKPFARALKKVAPSIPILGPAITSTSWDFNWLQGTIGGDHKLLGVLSGHRYPLNACMPASSPEHPTIARVVSEATSSVMAGSIRHAAKLAHSAGRPFRLDEFNSITCGGTPGVSDTFATALWAPDALSEVLRTGADGVNIHIRPTKVNGPLTLTPTGISARPLLYGMMLFARELGPGARLLRWSINGPGSSHVKAWPVRVSGKHLHVLLDNKGNQSVTLEVRVLGKGNATLQRLLGPSVSATSGATLAGQQIGSDGNWTGALSLQTIARDPSGYQVTMPGSSAGLLDVQLP